MTGGTPVKMSQGYEILRPKADKALPISCNEWDVLRNQIGQLTTEPWLFQSLGSLLLGASLATLIAIWTDAIPLENSQALVVAKAISAVCGFCGLCCVYFAHKERSVHRAKAQVVSTQMQLIEQRFER
jgi:hypothetical protein